MRRPMKDVKQSAYHEAGHILHWVTNIYSPFVLGWVRRDTGEPIPACASEETIRAASEEGLGGCLFTGRGTIYTDTTTVIENYMAGLAGERIMRGTKTAGKLTMYALLRGCMNDWRGASAAVDEHNARPNRKFTMIKEGYINRCLASAWKQLRRRRKAHRLIAEHLIEHGTITYEEAKAIADANPGRRR